MYSYGTVMLPDPKDRTQLAKDTIEFIRRGLKVQDPPKDATRQQKVPPPTSPNKDSRQIPIQVSDPYRSDDILPTFQREGPLVGRDVAMDDAQERSRYRSSDGDDDVFEGDGDRCSDGDVELNVKGETSGTGKGKDGGSQGQRGDGGKGGTDEAPVRWWSLPQNLEHQRIVVATYGWTLKAFVDCLELVRVLEDVVIGAHSWLPSMSHSVTD